MNEADRFAEVTNGFSIGRLGQGLRASLLPIVDGFLGEACTGGVMSEGLKGPVFGVALKNVQHACVQLLPPRLKQTFIGGIADQRVFKRKAPA